MSVLSFKKANSVTNAIWSLPHFCTTDKKRKSWKSEVTHSSSSVQNQGMQQGQLYMKGIQFSYEHLWLSWKPKLYEKNGLVKQGWERMPAPCTLNFYYWKNPPLKSQPHNNSLLSELGVTHNDNEWKKSPKKPTYEPHPSAIIHTKLWSSYLSWETRSPLHGMFRYRSKNSGCLKTFRPPKWQINGKKKCIPINSFHWIKHAKYTANYFECILKLKCTYQPC